MARIDPTCALVLWDSRLAVADREANTGATLTSSYTEAEKRPGLPVSMGRLTAQISGDQDAAVDLEVSTKAGIPGRDGCSVLASVDGGATHYGHQPEAHIRYHDILESGASDAFNEIGGCTTSQGTPLVGVYDALYRFNGASWASVYDYDPLPGGTRKGHNGVAICEDPTTGLLIAVTHDSGAIYTHHSDDDGLTWQFVATQDYATTAGSRIALAANRGGMVLVIQANGTSGDAHQLGSSDLGQSWTEVDTDTGVGLGWSIVTSQDTMFVTYYDVSTAEVVMRRITSPYQSALTGSTVTVTSRTNVRAVTVWGDIAGRLYCLVRDDEGTLGTNVHDGKLVVIVSNDGGISWVESAASWISAATNVGPTNMVGMHTPYGALIACNGASPSSTNQDRSVHLLWLGGWSTLEATPGNDQFSPNGSGTGTGDSTGVLWLPFSQPGGAGFSATGAGTVTFDGTPLGLSGQRYYTLSNGPATLGTAAVLDFSCDSGGSLSSLQVGAHVTWTVFSTNYELQLRATTTGFRIRDIVAGSNLGTVSIDMTERLEIHLTYNAVAYRRPADDAWTIVALASTSGVGSGSASEFRFGNFTASGQTSTWHAAGITRSSWGDVATKDVTYGKPPPCYLPPAVGKPCVLNLYDGPGIPSDSCTIEPRANYSIEHLDPQVHPSPDTRWRSTQTASAEHVVWDLGDETQLGKSVALVVAGGSLRQARISYYDGASWQTAGTLDLATGFESLSFAMDGDIMEPDPGGTTAGGRFINENELVGGYVIVDPAGTPTTHRILANTGGLWDDGSGVVPSLRLENASGIAATGTCTLVAPGGVMVVSPSSTIRARYWRVRFVAGQDCPDDRFEAGVCWLGRLLPFGAPPDWTWTDTTEPNVQRTASPYGTIRQRRNGPPGRMWSWGWSDGGVRLYPLRSADADMDVVGVSGGRGIIAEEDVWGALTGAIHTHQALPVCALRQVPANGVTITDPTLWLYGVLEGSVSARNVVGVEGEDEIMRIDSITVREQR